MKIYDSDPVVPYKTSKIGANQTRAEIDGLLARWGIKESGWKWDPEGSDIALTFVITEQINGQPVRVVVKVSPPVIWTKATRAQREAVNWRVSMRTLWWYIKGHLEMAYLSQGDKTTQFLPFLQSRSGVSLRDLVIPEIGHIDMLKALPKAHETGEKETIEVEATEVSSS